MRSTDVKSVQSILQSIIDQGNLTVAEVNGAISSGTASLETFKNLKLQELVGASGNLTIELESTAQDLIKLINEQGARVRINQPSHGFTLNAIQYDVVQGKYVKADKDVGADSVAFRVDDNFFDIVTDGVYDIDSTLENLLETPLENDEHYFLDPFKAGGYTGEKPTTVFQPLFLVSKNENKTSVFVDVAVPTILTPRILVDEISNLGLATIDKMEITYGNIDLMKADPNLKPGQVIEVQGYYSPGDGAHHKRKIEAQDDGSGVQLANGLWANIVHSGEVNVSWFGAKGDGVTDDSASIQSALNFCKVVKINDGEFFVGKSLTQANNTIKASNFLRSILRSSGGYPIISGNLNYLKLEGIRFIGDKTEGSMAIKNTGPDDSGYRVSISDCQFLRFDTACEIRGVFFEFENCFIDSNNKGILIKHLKNGLPSTCFKFDRCSFAENKEFAISDDPDTSVSNQAPVINIRFEDCGFEIGKYGILENRVLRGLTVANCWFENLTSAGASIYADEYKVFINNRIEKNATFEQKSKDSLGFQHGGLTEIGGRFVKTRAIKFAGFANQEERISKNLELTYDGILKFDGGNFVYSGNSSDIKVGSIFISRHGGIVRRGFDDSLEISSTITDGVCNVNFDNFTLVGSSIFVTPATYGTNATRFTAHSSPYSKDNASTVDTGLLNGLNCHITNSSGNVVLSNVGYHIVIIYTSVRMDSFFKSSQDYVTANPNIVKFKDYILSINTPYHTTKMQQEGVYDDFMTYMDELHSYEQSQRNTTEDVATLNVLVEPQPSQALLDFKKKYLG